MTEAHEGMHERELARIVELEAGGALSSGGDRRLRQSLQLPAINEGFEDILLDIEVVVVDGRERRAQRRQIVDGFLDAIVGDVVARSLGAQDEMVAHILFDEAVAIVAANDRVGEVHVLDLGLQLATMKLGDFAAEDRGDLVWLTDGAIGVEKPLGEFVEGVVSRSRASVMLCERWRWTLRSRFVGGGFKPP